MSSHRSALFVLNPAAGTHDPDDTESAVVDRLRNGGVEVEVRRTEGEGDARRWAQEAAGGGDVDLVVVAGGDGTVREVVSGVVAGGGDVAVAIVPLGTADLLARALGVPVGDLGAAADVAVDGEGRSIDVIDVVGRGEHAVVMVDAGFDAQLVRDSDRGSKNALGPFAYVASGVQNLFDLQQVELELELDGEVRRMDGHTVLCLNIGRIGDTFVVDETIEPDDGSLHVGVVTDPGAAGAVVTALTMATGDREKHADVVWSTCRRVRVTATPPLEVQVDGDPAGETPFELALLPGAVTVLVPTAEDQPTAASG
ncbi:MAG: diacylglycerol/lipid kinase family protein [Nitriliruptoraceae bacterium]